MNDKERQQATDEKLVKAVLLKDFDAFREIVRRYSNALYSVAYSHVGDFHEAQDVVQEAFIKAYQNIHHLNEPRKLGSWLYTIVQRLCLDRLKQQKDRVIPLETWKESYPLQFDPVGEWFDKKEMREMIWQALQTLEEKNRIVTVLFHLNDWSMKEIASFLNLTVSAIESRLRRSRQTLKKKMSDVMETYLKDQKLDTQFEEKVSHQLLKRIGHFYIPVSDRNRSKNWYMKHFQLNVTKQGHLALDSGDELYLLEIGSSDNLASYREGMPILCFRVDDADTLWRHLYNQGVKVDKMKNNKSMGKTFHFEDLDRNRFSIIEIN